MRVPVAQMPQPQLIEHRLHPLFHFARGDLTQPERVGDILEYRFVRPQGVGLKHQPKIARLGRNFAARIAVIDRMFADGYPPAGGFLQPGHRAQQGGFPAARWPQ
jgi:hypothetical protein